MRAAVLPRVAPDLRRPLPVPCKERLRSRSRGRRLRYAGKRLQSPRGKAGKVLLAPCQPSSSLQVPLLHGRIHRRS